mmetsp:Transcript_39870/g.66159  ORF Transcript_39870/g.66159 Transcript_39870/m.66159 type:complete len:209 (+) Transcript_39870:208-834(+)|eukprot:CAMPEP_0119345160 /NCGR_PEP_ID=MMETSP1333-20130426/107342_1 /TAXON_ID=418940 /ORGANISM="Scyphosphaera apsteinii, Strain RCC1455" /LENGTH=208 /DNA_ID=CAMNT_0007357617 /DNA_START=208 /DNA_END=834 /DNA_ORIENTATION=-
MEIVFSAINSTTSAGSSKTPWNRAAQASEQDIVSERAVSNERRQATDATTSEPASAEPSKDGPAILCALGPSSKWRCLEDEGLSEFLAALQVPEGPKKEAIMAVLAKPSYGFEVKDDTLTMMIIGQEDKSTQHFTIGKTAQLHDPQGNAQDVTLYVEGHDTIRDVKYRPRDLVVETAIRRLRPDGKLESILTSNQHKKSRRMVHQKYE